MHLFEFYNFLQSIQMHVILTPKRKILHLLFSTIIEKLNKHLLFIRRRGGRIVPGSLKVG